MYIWTRIDTRQAGFSHRTEGDLLTCTAYPGNGIDWCSLPYPQIICNTFFKQQLKRLAKSGNRRYCCSLQKHVSSWRLNSAISWTKFWWKRWIPSEFSSGQGGTMDCYKKLEWPAESVTLDDVVENTDVLSCFQAISRRFWGGRRFVLLVGFVQNEDPGQIRWKPQMLSFPASTSGLNHVWSIFKRFQDDFEGVFVFGSSVFVLYPLANLLYFIPDVMSENVRC